MSQQQAEIEFPVEWTFRIIVESAAAAAALPVLRMIFAGFGKYPELTEGRGSSGGKYGTWQAQVTLSDRRELEELPKQLSQVPGVRMVL